MSHHAAGLRLWLVRHAAPCVAPGTCYGALDVSADTEATRAAAARLATALPLQARVFFSTLQRCEQLAYALQALRPDLPPTPDARLREMGFGAWEGRAWNAIPRSDIDTWTDAFATHAPGGGEALATMLERVGSALQAARQLHTGHAVKDVVWITHAGVARCVEWLQQQGAKAMPRSEDWPIAAPGWGDWDIRVLS
jgi:alpha-ribazole phosphatase